MRARSDHRGPGSSLGFTMVEVIVVVALLAVLSSLALPSVQRMRQRSALQNGRHMITSALSLARASGAQWGRTSIVRLDTILDEVRIVVDTGAAGSGLDTLVVRQFRLADALGVQLEADRSSLCFNSRGVGAVASGCPATGATLRLAYGGAEDTIVVSPVGRIRK